MKKFSLLFIILCTSIIASAGDLIDYHFQIKEYRWGEYKYDFNTTKAYGKGFISIDEDGSGYVYVEWNSNNKSFALGARDLLEVNDSEASTIRLTYKYGYGEVSIEINRYGAIVHYSYGDKFKIWKEY